MFGRANPELAEDIFLFNDDHRYSHVLSMGNMHVQKNSTVSQLTVRKLLNTMVAGKSTMSPLVTYGV